MKKKEQNITFKISRKDLSQAIAIVKPALNPTPIVPITGSFKIEITEGVSTISASNIEVGIKTNLNDVEFTDVGSFCIAGYRLSELVNGLPDQMLDISVTGNTAVIKAASGEYSFPVEDAEHFPSHRLSSDQFCAEINGIDLVANIKRGLVAASTNVQDKMYGLCIDFAGNNLSVVGASHMSVSCCTVGIPEPFTRRVVISPKAAQLFASMPNIELIQLSVYDGHIKLLSEDYSISAVLIESNYVDYQRLTKFEHKGRIMLSKGELLPSLKRLSKFSSVEHSDVELMIKEGTMTLLASNESSETAVEKIPVDGDIELTIKCNCGHLGELIGNVPGESLIINATDFKTILMITTEGWGGQSVIAPIVIN